ncbi:MAG: bifunctional DNA-formamidopyrimidine glycosylase/DNA-(apurinic or apyrimidinic site) lyase [Burkholderiales bacterium]|nr:bifunctional DNA-formamidopyrimidine glycosylase/DNA-(apurinic or apyrimidinic site) lyase [Burkholderiales bacterium]
MPELPEVETVKRGLQAMVEDTITNVIVRFPRLRYPLDSEKLNLAQNQKILSISRRAKYLIIHMESGYIIIHLGMSGKVTLYKKNDVPEIIKHDHVDITSNNHILRYNDARRFGCVVYSPDLSSLEMLNTLGPEPFSEEFNAEYLFSKISTRKTPIKQLIMDNAVVVGVGNIYACESLFLCKISPLRIGNEVTLDECYKLVNIIQQVLTKAIAAGGSSLRDYRDAEGNLGYFQQSHLVYGRAKKECKECNTPITEIRLGQRNSFYCPNCQS